MDVLVLLLGLDVCWLGEVEAGGSVDEMRLDGLLEASRWKMEMEYDRR